MTYHRNAGSFSSVIPRQLTKEEIARNRAVSDALTARVKSGAPITREQVLYMFRTAPMCEPWGGPSACPPYPTDVKAAVERMAPGAIVPAASVRRVYAMWNPGLR